MMCVGMILGLTSDDSVGHPLLLEYKDRQLVSILVERIRRVPGLASLVYVADGQLGPDGILEELSAKLRHLAVDVAHRRSPSLVERVRRDASTAEFLVIFDCRCPFLSPALVERALKTMQDQKRDYLTFSRELAGLAPVEIVRCSFVNRLDDAALADVGGYSERVGEFPDAANRDYSPNRYWEDRVSITPAGEYWEDFCPDFQRLFGNWIVPSAAKLKDIVKAAARRDFRRVIGDLFRPSRSSLKRIATTINSLGADEPNDEAIELAIERDMARNRQIVRRAVERGGKGTREIRDANVALCKWEARRNVDRPVSFPILVYLGITDICNARCRFCRYCPEEVTGFSIDLDQFKRLDWLRFAKRLYLHCGLGEPFAHPRIAEIMEHCRENLPALELRTATNGSLLSERVLRAIVGYMTSVGISINAGTKQTFERTMPPLKWDRVMGNLEALHREKQRLGTDRPEVNMTYVAHVENIEELHELPRLAASVGVKQIGVVHFKYKTSKYIQDYLFPETHSLVYHQTLYDQSIRKAKKEAEKHGVNLAHPPLFARGGEDADSAGELPVGPEFGFQRGHNVCFHPWTRLFVRPDAATITFCCTLGVSPDVKFTWPDSKSFHDELWHREPLAGTRRIINHQGELPSCVFCKTKNKRNPKLRHAWLRANEASKDVFRGWGVNAVVEC